MSRLVEKDMTNKPMGLKKRRAISKVNLIKVPNLQVSYKGKTNIHSHSQGLYLFIYYELHATLNDLNWKFLEF